MAVSSMESGTLRRHAANVLADVYEDALVLAITETGLVPATFPSTCPYSIEQLLQLQPENFTLPDPDRA